MFLSGIELPEEYHVSVCIHAHKLCLLFFKSINNSNIISDKYMDIMLPLVIVDYHNVSNVCIDMQCQ